MNELEKLLHGQPEAAEEFLVCKEQIDSQGGVNLNHDRVFRVADKTLDAQVLFDFLEKQFDFPAFFIDIGDGFGAQPEVIGQELVMFTAFRVTIADAAQAQGFSLADDLNDMVGSDAGFTVHRAALQQLIHGVALEAGHKKDALFRQGSKPGIVDKSLVENHDGAFGQFQRFGHAAFMGFGVGDGRKCRDMPVVVQQSVHFDAALGLTERSPGKKRQTKLDGGGVQAEQLGFEAELVFRGFCRTLAAHFDEQSLGKTTGLELLASATVERATVFRPSDTGVSPPALRQRRPSRMERPRKLGKSHGDELFLEA